jgi:hypothetical protein
MRIALDNVVAVVTGAAGGIGRELVKALKAAHATVITVETTTIVSLPLRLNLTLSAQVPNASSLNGSLMRAWASGAGTWSTIRSYSGCRLSFGWARSSVAQPERPEA